MYNFKYSEIYRKNNKLKCIFNVNYHNTLNVLHN